MGAKYQDFGAKGTPKGIIPAAGKLMNGTPPSKSGGAPPSAPSGTSSKGQMGYNGGGPGYSHKVGGGGEPDADD